MVKLVFYLFFSTTRLYSIMGILYQMLFTFIVFITFQLETVDMFQYLFVFLTLHSKSAFYEDRP